MIEIEGPDGVIYEFPSGTDDATIRTAMGKVYGAPQAAAPQQAQQPVAATEQPQERGFWHRLGDNVIGFDDGVTTRGERLGRQLDDAGKAAAAGIGRGVAGMMDLPGAAFGAGGDLGAYALEKTGMVSPEVAEGVRQSFDMMPMGSGDQNRNALASATGGASEFRGETTAGRYAGTAGEFLPGAFGGGGMVRNALVYGVLPGLASEAAGQATEGTAAEPFARAIAPIITGGIAGALTRPKGPQAPSTADLRQTAEGLYQTGRQRPGAGPQDVAGLRQSIDGQLRSMSRITPTGRTIAPQGVDDFLKVLDDYNGQPVSPAEMQNLRSFLQDAAKSTDAQDRRVGTALLEKFDDWRNQHVPEFKQADEAYGRLKRSEDVDFRIEKAENRASSTGTGGNQVNAARQNIRQILDDPKKQRGYSQEELDLMRAIVRGDRSTNSLRLIGRLSPTSGALPLMGSLTGAGVAPQIAIPLMGVSAGAKGAAEVLTNRQINALSATIRNGGPLPVNALAGIDDAALAILAARSSNGAGPR